MENSFGSAPQTPIVPPQNTNISVAPSTAGQQVQTDQLMQEQDPKTKKRKKLILLAILAFILTGIAVLSRQNPQLQKKSETSPNPVDEQTVEQDDKVPSLNETPVVTPTGVPVKTSLGIPFGPFHFGERENDYSFTTDNTVAGDIFNGGFIHFGTADTDAKVKAADTILALARSKGKRVIVSITDLYPCRYWDNRNFDGDLLIKDAKYLVPTVARYYPETVIGVMLLNEPHDPQDECGTQIPPKELYDAAREIREEFFKENARYIPLGFGAPPSYMEGKITVDGTITLSNAQYTTNRGDLGNFIYQQEGAASRLGQKLYLTANANQTGEKLDEFLKIMCQKANQDTTIMVGYWTWNESGGNQKVSLSELTSARDACRER